MQALHQLQEAISSSPHRNSNTAVAQAMARIQNAAPPLESALRRERVQVGVDRARQQGKQLGRPRLSVNEEEIVRRVKLGQSKKSIAKHFGIGQATVRAILDRSMTPAAPNNHTAAARSQQTLTTLASWLPEQMRLRKMDKYAFAEKGGPNYHTIDKILKGAPIYGSTLQKLAEALGVDESQIPGA